MSKKIIGAFVFKDVGDGCLIGKWLNRDEPTAYPESAKFESKNKDSGEKFCGIYVTTWVEQINLPINANLEISKKNGTIYNLKWYNSTGIIFHGNAMLYDGSLVGTYWE